MVSRHCWCRLHWLRLFSSFSFTWLIDYCLQRLLELQNYNGLMAVMSALNSSTITRLKRTWDALGGKSKATYGTLNKAVSHDRNYAAYRAALRKAQAPCLPFLGVYLTDVTFCHEGNPATRTSPLDPNLKLINFDRYQVGPSSYHVYRQCFQLS